MITLIILLAILALGIYLVSTYDYDILGVIVIVLSACFLLLHLAAWLPRSYNYEQFAVQRTAFKQTLDESRKAGRQYETAAIVQRVAEWNQQLASQKHSNSTLFLDQYVDDRIEKLEPIK